MNGFIGLNLGNGFCTADGLKELIRKEAKTECLGIAAFTAGVVFGYSVLTIDKTEITLKAGQSYTCRGDFDTVEVHGSLTLSVEYVIKTENEEN